MTLEYTDPSSLPVPRDDSLKATDDYVGAELTAGWAKKTSIETRAFSIVTVNTTVATLYIAVQLQFGLVSANLSAWPKFVLILALVSSACSIALAALASVPSRYREPSAEDLTGLLQRALDPDYILTRAEIIQGRIVEFERLAESNTRKARFIAASFFSLGCFVICIISGLILANHT